MTYGTVNADVITTSTAGGVLGAGNASIMKNRIINGAMVIDQRNAGASITPTSSTFTTDRWQLVCSVASKASAQQVSTAPTGFVNSLKITSTSAYSVGSTDYICLQQAIEGYNVADLGWGTASAKTVTLSFWVQSSLTGTFGGSLVNSALDRSYPFTYTISAANTWEYKTVTVAGDTSGTWLTTNSAGIRVYLGLGIGSTYTGTAGAWAGTLYLNATGATNVLGTNGATIQWTGVQLEVGSSATGFEYRQYGTELDLCSRYCFVQGWPQGGATYSYYAFGIGYAENATIFTGVITYPVSMRTKPSLTASIGTTFYTNYFTPDSSAATLDQASKDSGLVNITGSSGVAGKAGRFMVNATQTCYLIWSAEL